MGLHRQLFKFLIVVFIGWKCLHGFPPQNEEAFINNCLRLLNTQQYSFLTSYFVEYYPKFNQPKNTQYLETIVVRIPFIDKKEEILKTYINHTEKIAAFAYDLYGQIKLFQKDYHEVIKSYLLYDQPQRFFYLGIAEKELGNLIDSREWFLKALKAIKNKDMLAETHLGLAEIYIKWENFSEARKSLRKVSDKNFHKLILYYKLYKGEKNEKFLKRLIQRIKRYRKEPIIKDFIEKENIRLE